MSAAHRLLVVDDDAPVVEFLGESLTAQGYAIETETSPEHALERIERDAFDLVITDLQMPGMRGTDMLRAILSRQPEQLVLLMTAFGSIDLAVAAVRAGACDFIAKPFKIEALQLAIERAFRDREMRREIVRLKARLPAADDTQLVAKSQAMKGVVDRARRIADLDSTVLLTGETGTGKGRLAKFVHESSQRRHRPFQHVNCASLPAPLIESELFGVRRGAFTDAREDRPGAWLAAGDGTLFLDEVGELSLELQAKLLHSLEDGRVRPLWSTSDQPVRARVIAATNRPLEALLKEGQFRPDLYFRLNVIRIEVPPLRQRREDIIPLADMMLTRMSSRHPRPVVGMSAAAIRRLIAYPWPGNVRELSNLIERAVALCDHDTLLPSDLDFPKGPHAIDALLSGTHEPVRLDELERLYVRRVLESRGGNKAETARVLGINRRTLYRMLHGVSQQ